MANQKTTKFNELFTTAIIALSARKHSLPTLDLYGEQLWNLAQLLRHQSAKMKTLSEQCDTAESRDTYLTTERIFLQQERELIPWLLAAEILILDMEDVGDDGEDEEPWVRGLKYAEAVEEYDALMES